MRRIAVWIAATVTVVVLLFGYHTSTEGTAALGDTTPVTGRSLPGRGSGGTGSSSRTFSGDVAQTERGPVQVALVVKNKKITGVKILQSPTQDPMDVRINQYAVPILIKETLSAQSARIDMVSGATVTSDGYVQSLQSALDRAGI